MILEAAYAAHSTVGSFAFWMGCAAAFLTAFYSWRLLILAFHGKPRASAEVMAHVHESPTVMTLPLLVLAIGAIFSGWLGYELFVGTNWQQFWGDSIFILPTHTAMENAHHVPGLGENAADCSGRQWRHPCGDLLCRLHWFAGTDCRSVPSIAYVLLQQMVF
jgi:NADH:ubiquinone oxidoreductase subunit 5 (subunit L)/multisubunit Na+/H+ antiporter MnhA subunit